ncbi:PROTEIN EMBRYO SAC DEVELOPMENT ARREST 30 [Salix purpurea]|uniref:O-fucosyltransferase family protein n=1 Tax=Salix purpurea TaxID=77065 RepID=A0A9Q0WC89_SALPP|nr:PROTEIN EMBRYO SAC DEVELOPMENT ARREST 30 [Salix purpurea]KAJ6763074.1 PROTEIN EMBRYO SAC DEVELOPMENT ARREST 30 [Salix purpurea]
MKMVFKSKIKWIALFVLILSTVSLVVHLSITRLSGAYSMQSTLMPFNGFDFTASIFAPQSDRFVINKKLWGPVKSLKSLQPYANPRSNYPVPSERTNGYIYAKIFGGFEKIRSAICDLVTISRLLNATLVIPEIQESLQSKHISYKFKSFSYLYDEDQFIASLKNDVNIVKSLPENLKAARRRNEFRTYKPKRFASPNFYVKEILPVLKKSKVIGLLLHDGGCLQSILPPSMFEFQRLRCRDCIPCSKVSPGNSDGWPVDGSEDVHAELIQYRRAQMIKQGILNGELRVDSQILRDNGSCPLMPEEVGLLLQAMGYSNRTVIYVAGSETFGGQRVLIPLRAMFSNTVDRTRVCTKQELSDLVGPETPLPLNPFQPPPTQSEEQLKEKWNMAGPRPRPLPPPPDRPTYRHEKEGWYGWITESDTEPDPSPVDLRMQAHRLLWDALDYIVSVEADAFFPGFHNDGSGWPDFSSLVMGQRLYESASSKTYRPDRRVLEEFFNITRDNMYYHHNYSWKLSVREHLNKSLSEDGLIRQSLLSKPATFLSHPLPECSCRIPSAEVPKQVKGNDGRFLYGGEDECPIWMKHSQEETHLESAMAGDGSNGNTELEFENDGVEEQESDDNAGKSSLTQLHMDQDDEWDPND